VEISDAYRKARRNTSIFCGISIAWSAAQFDLSSLNIGGAGKVDLSGASIPTILASVIIYTIVSCTIEFMMQPNEVRRWSLAQIDYKITLNLVRVSLLTIAAASASRSLETVIGVVVAALAFIFSYFVLVMALMLILMPLRMYIRSRQGRISAASSAMEATAWSMFIVGVSYLLLFITLGFSAFNKMPYFELLPKIPNQISTIVFATTSIIITVSYFFEGVILKKVFAFVPVMIERSYFDETGKKIFSIEPNPAHPEYEKHKHQSPLVYTKVKRNEKADTSTKCSDGGNNTEN
jgi:hypothetical protein